MTKSFGVLRHLFTALPTTRQRPGGFQTLAYSRDLGTVLEPIRSLVEGYQAAGAGAPSCRQVLPVPGRSRVYALSIFTPTGPTPDDRPGNYWAETVVVPAQWLEGGDWDVAAAFAAIDWAGPQDPATVAEELPPMTPQPLAAGPLDRLARLVQAVPEHLLFPLLLAVVQQSDGLRPLRILESPEADPIAVEDVVTLLPLVVPPAMRTYRDEDLRRCMTLRTRSPLGGMPPAADVIGFPAAAAETPAMEHAVVIDLGGRVPPPPLRGRFGEGYARWLHRVLLEGRWEELAERHRDAAGERHEDWLTRFDGETATTAAASNRSASPAATGPAVLARRQQAWRIHEEAEAEAWELLSAHRQALEDQLGDFRDEMHRAVKEASGKLARLLESERETLERNVERKLKSSRRPTTSDDPDFAQPDFAQPDFAQPGLAPPGLAQPELARTGLAQHLADLDEDLRRLHSQVQVLRGEPAGTGRATRSPAPWASRWQALTAGRFSPLFVTMLLLAPVLLRLPFWAVVERPRREAAGETRIAGPSEEERLRALEESFQEGETATRLVRRAASEEPFRRRAHAVVVAQTLGATAPSTDSIDKAILQQALGIAVDGQWGPSSSESLRGALSDDCASCQATGAGAWNSSPANCFLMEYIGLDGPSCAAESPWRTSRAWTVGEAEAALGLIRATVESLHARGKTDLAEQLAKLDPKTRDSPLFDQLRSLPSVRGDLFFDLAYALITGDPEDVAPSRIPARRVDVLAELLADLSPEPTSRESAASETPSRETEPPASGGEASDGGGDS